MQDVFGVAALNGADQLLEYRLGNILFELPSFAHVGEEVSACGQLNYNQHVFLGLKVLVEPHDVRVSCLLQNQHFLHDFLTLLFVFEVGSIY